MASQQKNHESSDLGDLEKLLQTSHHTCDRCGYKKKVSYSQYQSEENLHQPWLQSSGIALLAICALTLSIFTCAGMVYLFREINYLRNDNEWLKKSIAMDSINDRDIHTNDLKEEKSHGHISIQNGQYDLIHDNDAKSNMANATLSLSEDKVVDKDRDETENVDIRGQAIKRRWKRSSKSKKKNKNKKSKGPKKMLTIHLESEQDITRYSQEGKKFEDWIPDASIPHKSGYYYEKGSVEILKDGVYFIYSQLTYYTSYPTVSYGIYVTKEDATERCVMKCINSVEMNDDDDVGKRHQHCNTAQAVFLSKGEKVFITDQHAARGFKKDVMVEFAPDLSFWGIIKLI